MIACALTVVVIHRATSTARRGAGLAAFFSASVGRLIAHLLLVLVLSMICLAIPAFAARAVAVEHERGGLLGLQMTRLRPSALALAKISGVFLQAMQFLVVAAPFLALGHLLGGVRPFELYRSAFVIALFSLALSALCVAVSARVASPASALFGGYAIVASLVVGTIAVFALQGAISRSDDLSHLNHAVLVANPFMGVADAAAGRTGGDERFPSPFTPFHAMIGDRTTLIDQIQLLSGDGFARPQLNGRIPFRRSTRVWRQSSEVALALAVVGALLATRWLRFPARTRR